MYCMTVCFARFGFVGSPRRTKRAIDFLLSCAVICVDCVRARMCSSCRTFSFCFFFVLLWGVFFFLILNHDLVCHFDRMKSMYIKLIVIFEVNRDSIGMH